MIELPKLPPMPFLKKALKPLWDYLLRSRLVAGRGLSISERGNGGLLIELEGGSDTLGATPTTGSFCKVYPSGESPAIKTMLLGGIVSGGEGNITISEIELSDYGSSEEDGTFHWLEVSFTANSEDGLLFSGGNVTAATPGSGLSLPDNVLPTPENPDGTVYISLGQWMSSRFIPSGCGDFYVSHCPGSLTYQRQ